MLSPFGEVLPPKEEEQEKEKAKKGSNDTRKSEKKTGKESGAEKGGGDEKKEDSEEASPPDGEDSEDVSPPDGDYVTIVGAAGARGKTIGSGVARRGKQSIGRSVQQQLESFTHFLQINGSLMSVPLVRWPAAWQEVGARLARIFLFEFGLPPAAATALALLTAILAPLLLWYVWEVLWSDMVAWEAAYVHGWAELRGRRRREALMLAATAACLLVALLPPGIGVAAAFAAAAAASASCGLGYFGFVAIGGAARELYQVGWVEPVWP